MGSSVVDLGPGLVVALLALTAIAAAAGRLSGLGQDRPAVIAVVRATVQLAAVSAVLAAVLRSLWLSVAFALLMLGVAAVTAAGRITRRPLRSAGAARRVGASGLAIAAGAAPVVGVVLFSGSVPLAGIAVIPVAGIVIGGAMTATSLAGRRLRDELEQRRGEVEGALSLGFHARDAVLLVARPVAATALVPALDQTRTVGLVTLPGAFVGVLLGGGSAVQAGAAQLLVLAGLLAAEAISVWVTVEAVARARCGGDRPHRRVQGLHRTPPGAPQCRGAQWCQRGGEVLPSPWEGPAVTEQNRPADATGHGTDRTPDAGTAWAPQQSSGQVPPQQPIPAPGDTQQFPADTGHRPWPPVGWGVHAPYAGPPSGSQPFGQTGAVPPVFPAPPADPTQPPARRGGRWRLGIAAGLVGAALIGGGAGAGVMALTDDDAVATVNGTSAQSVVIKDPETATSATAAAAKASPSVVTVYVTASSGSGSGSGVVLTDDGYVLTNNHVVSLDSSTSDVTVQVRTADGTLYDATVVGTDPSSDLAVLRLSDASGLTPATFADSDDVQVGDVAVAIGAPLGLSNTVTTGIISATDRAVATGSDQEQTVIDALQTDAAINPGNSGGPLVDAAGEVVGINTAIAAVATDLPGQESQSGNIGVGFAIPSNTAQRIAQQIIDTGSATHALLGVSASTAADSSASAVGTGAQLVSVQEGSPAADAGLRAGDVITAVGDRPITTSTELTAAVRSAKPGDTVTLTVRRGDQTLTVDATLDEASD
ncbi:ABC transporter permease [Modestobacter marinus]|uniref:ABC transporter permease n=1 Tax=Modestobacter marinus TaxID=477641 RepID=UPI0027E080AE|nr:ABC transporter permease [Modestobacter marinus]